MSPERVRNFADLARLDWPTAAQVFADMPVRHELPDAGVHQARLYTESAKGDFVARLLTDGFETTDVRDDLPRLRMPVLVMQRRDDPLYGFSLSQRLAAAIPDARLVPLQEGIMSSLVAGRIEEVIAIINDFIDDGVAAATKPVAATGRGGVQAILFTDLVEHTQMMQRLGDDAGRAVLREHEQLTRATLARFGGTEIKATGDGFMAAFTSVASATECAIELQRAFADRVGEPLQIRVGLNAGEPIEEDGDLFGSTVIMASRIAARANAGEILLSDTMRGLLSGKKFLLADRGDVVMKGFEDPVRLYEVRWRE
jgi:class 3 adenylate cyclase